MCEILDYVDWDKIKAAEPKWYMGFSDNTNFTFLLPTLCDTAAIYGPCATNFGMEPWDKSLEDAYALLFVTTPSAFPLAMDNSVASEANIPSVHVALIVFMESAAP